MVMRVKPKSTTTAKSDKKVTGCDEFSVALIAEVMQHHGHGRHPRTMATALPPIFRRVLWAKARVVSADIVGNSITWGKRRLTEDQKFDKISL